MDKNTLNLKEVKEKLSLSDKETRKGHYTNKTDSETKNEFDKTRNELKTFINSNIKNKEKLYQNEVKNSSSKDQDSKTKAQRIKLGVQGGLKHLKVFNRIIIDWIANEITANILSKDDWDEKKPGVNKNRANWETFNKIIPVKECLPLFNDYNEDAIYEHMFKSVRNHMFFNVAGSLVFDSESFNIDLNLIDMALYFYNGQEFINNNYQILNDIKFDGFVTNLPYNINDDKLSLICDSFVRSITYPYGDNPDDPNNFKNIKKMGTVYLLFENSESYNIDEVKSMCLKIWHNMPKSYKQDLNNLTFFIANE